MSPWPEKGRSYPLSPHALRYPPGDADGIDIPQAPHPIEVAGGTVDQGDEFAQRQRQLGYPRLEPEVRSVLILDERSAVPSERRRCSWSRCCTSLPNTCLCRSAGAERARGSPAASSAARGGSVPCCQADNPAESGIDSRISDVALVRFRAKGEPMATRLLLLALSS